MPKRILIGKVTSNKADKTITVIVERRIMHPMYKKFITKSKKFAAHDGNNFVTKRASEKDLSKEQRVIHIVNETEEREKETKSSRMNTV